MRVVEWVPTLTLSGVKVGVDGIFKEWVKHPLYHFIVFFRVFLEWSKTLLKSCFLVSFFVKKWFL